MRYTNTICIHCQRIRSLADMRNGRCIYCPAPGLPRLGKPGVPPGFQVTAPPQDALEAQLRRMTK